MGKLFKKESFFGEKVKCFFFNNKKLEETKLPCYTNKSKNDKSAVLWYNADYALYIINKYFPEYDYYWRLEYDDFFNDSTWRSFFEQYKNNTSDLIVPFFEEAARDSWSWHEHSDWIYKGIKKYRSFFPAVRLSKRAAERLYDIRLEHKEKFKNINLNSGSRWIFCECFVPTEVIKNNFTACRLEGAELYPTEIDLNETRIWQKPDKKLYHPVKGNFIERLDKNKFAKTDKPFFYIGKTDDYSHFLIILFGIKIRFRIKEKI